MNRKQIKSEFYENLLQFCEQNSTELNDLYDYYEYVSNTNKEKVEKSVFKKNSLDKSTLNSIDYTKKSNFYINKNQYHCEHCKITYFRNSNCVNANVKIKPKCYLSFRNAKLLTKHRLFNKKYKYNSYKHRLVKKLIKTSVKLVYKCKKCQKNNIIYKQDQRNNFDQLKFVTNKVKNDKIKTQTILLKYQQSNSSSSNTTSSTSIKQKNFHRNKKFQSLKLAFENEKKLNKAQTQSTSSLTDFLEKIK